MQTTAALFRTGSRPCKAIDEVEMTCAANAVWKRCVEAGFGQPPARARTVTETGLSRVARDESTMRRCFCDSFRAPFLHHFRISLRGVACRLRWDSRLPGRSRLPRGNHMLPPSGSRMTNICTGSGSLKAGPCAVRGPADWQVSYRYGKKSSLAGNRPTRCRILAISGFNIDRIQKWQLAL